MFKLALSRQFTKREALIILVLVLLLVAVLYYQFIYRSTEERLAAIQLEDETLQTEFLMTSARLSRLKRMEAEIEEIMGQGQFRPIAKYDNQKHVMAMLSSILSSAVSYNMSFTTDEQTAQDEIIRRKISLNFVAEDFASAREIINRLAMYEYRCQVSDIMLSNSDKLTSVTLIITFFEVRE